MISLSLQQAASAMQGRLSGVDMPFVGVTTDSRSVGVGQLFFALRGDNFDGHAFVSSVLDQGAAAVVVEQEMDVEGPQIVVANTRLALGALASYWRKQFAIPMIAITGSNGKTTVKEMVTAIAQKAFGESAVHATAGNFNNEIGLPLTLFKLGAEHRCAVLEMGMNHPGELTYLSALAAPTAALVNNAQAAHLEGLGSVAAVAQAKGEIYSGLAADGVGIFNAEDAFAPLWQGLLQGHAQLGFGLESGEVRAQQLEDGQVEITTPNGALVVALQVPGVHNLKNAAAATAAALALGIELPAIQQGLASFAGVKGRLQKKIAPSMAAVIDDTYNANPGSVKAAIDVLKAEAGTRLLVLGDIGELGAESRALHQDLGVYARAAEIDGLLTLGEHMQAAQQAYGEGAQHFSNLDELVSALKPQLKAGVTVLVKGSRFMKMERVVARILEQE